MSKIAWSKQTFDAYHYIKKNQKVLLPDGTCIGIANGWAARCTATTPGSIQLDTGVWISGDVEKENDYWIMTERTTVDSIVK